MTSSETAAAGNQSSALPTEVVLRTLGGEQIAFGDLAGQDTLLWFWAPW